MGNYINQDISLAINSLARAYVIYDLNLNLLKASDLAVKLFGWHREELLGKSLHELERRYLNPSFFEAIEATAKDCIQREITHSRDTQDRVINHSISRIGDVLLVESTDMTSTFETRWRERMKAKLHEEILNSIDESVLIIDFIDQTLTPNQKCLDTFGELTSLESDFFAASSFADREDHPGAFVFGFAGLAHQDLTTHTKVPNQGTLPGNRKPKELASSHHLIQLRASCFPNK